RRAEGASSGLVLSRARSEFAGVGVSSEQRRSIHVFFRSGPPAVREWPRDRYGRRESDSRIRELGLAELESHCVLRGSDETGSTRVGIRRQHVLLPRQPRTRRTELFRGKLRASAG